MFTKISISFVTNIFCFLKYNIDSIAVSKSNLELLRDIPAPVVKHKFVNVFEYLKANHIKPENIIKLRRLHGDKYVIL